MSVIKLFSFASSFVHFFFHDRHLREAISEHIFGSQNSSMVELKSKSDFEKKNYPLSVLYQLSSVVLHDLRTPQPHQTRHLKPQ